MGHGRPGVGALWETEAQKLAVACARFQNKQYAGLRPETAFLSPNLDSVQDLTVDPRVSYPQGGKDIRGLCLLPIL